MADSGLAYIHRGMHASNHLGMILLIRPRSGRYYCVTQWGTTEVFVMVGPQLTLRLGHPGSNFLAIPGQILLHGTGHQAGTRRYSQVLGTCRESYAESNPGSTSARTSTGACPNLARLSDNVCKIRRCDLNSGTLCYILRSTYLSPGKIPGAL